MKKIYEGKAKAVFETEDPQQLVQRFKDSATAFNGVKFANISGKGELNNRISSTVFRYLADAGCQSHYLATLNARDMLIRRVSIIPLEVVVRNIYAGSLAKRLGVNEGDTLKQPIIELYYKNDALGDPLINEDHVALLGIASSAELQNIRSQAFAVNELLQKFWGRCGLKLVDFKLEFGRDSEGTVLLADEISPDTSRLWTVGSDRKMDKDVFRRDLADLGETYSEVLSMLSQHYAAFVPGELDAVELQ